MGGTISLKSSGYLNIKNEIKIAGGKSMSIYEAVDIIVEDLLHKNAQMIMDIEKGKSHKKILDTEIYKIVEENNLSINEVTEIEEVVKQVHNYLWGYAYVNKYIEDKDVSDIAIKGTEDIWIKRNGVRERADVAFPSIRSVYNFAYNLAVKNGGNLSRHDALAVLTDNNSSEYFNLRINIGIEPVNTNCPHIVIRKIPKYTIKPDMNKLEALHMFSSAVKLYIINAFRRGLNVLIVGQGASGKTTLLNAAIEEIPEYMSKLCIQESTELSSGKGNWIFETVVNKYGESEVEYTLQKLATNGLLLDIDWFIIGESKGAESMGIYDASFTGHKVALTAHAPSSHDGIERLILNMKKSGTDYRREDLLKMLSVMDVVIFMKRFKVFEITEIEGFDEVKKDIIYRPIYKFDVLNETRTGLVGSYRHINESCSRVLEKLTTMN